MERMLCSKKKRHKREEGEGEEEKFSLPEERARSSSDLLDPTLSRSDLLAPLTTWDLSPIPRADENYDQMYKRLGFQPPKGDLENSIYECVDHYEPLHMLEISEREMVYTGEKQQKMYQPYKGQIKLSVYLNYGLLTVHVIQGRHLNSKFKDTCDSYVKLALVPDNTKRTKCKTETILESNHPVYDEKFSFELLDEDFHKRLLISVWNKDKRKGRSEFLGCMSFGIQHIGEHKRTIHGWYYLLTEDVGRKKHLQVSASRRQHLQELNAKNIPKVNQDVAWMEPHVIVIRQYPSGGGYGFSLTGVSPVRVCKVEPGTPAFNAGLQADDSIIRINHLNVSRSGAESVARIIRHCPQKIILEIQRRQRVGLMDSSPRKPLTSTILSHQDDAVYTNYGYISHRPQTASGGSGHHSGHHSDSELEVEPSKHRPAALPFSGFCGTLPRRPAQRPVQETLC